MGGMGWLGCSGLPVSKFVNVPDNDGGGDDKVKPDQRGWKKSSIQVQFVALNWDSN